MKCVSLSVSVLFAYSPPPLVFAPLLLKVVLVTFAGPPIYAPPPFCVPAAPVLVDPETIISLSVSAPVALIPPPFAFTVLLMYPPVMVKPRRVAATDATITRPLWSASSVVGLPAGL